MASFEETRRNQGGEDSDDDIGDQDHEYNVGDLVWVRNRPWWPGQIYDPSDASDYALRLKGKKGHILVAYFGDGSFSWCTSDQLKPFVENFAEMSERSSSKGFVNAVQEALDAISRLVEMEMGCKISPEFDDIRDARPYNDGIKEGVDWPVGGFGKYLIARYEPKELIARLRNVAKAVAIDRLEVTVLKSWLSAYRCAKGWPTMPFYNYPEGNQSSDLAEDPVEGERFLLPVGVVGSGTKEGPAILSGDNQRRKERSMAELMADLTNSDNLKSTKRKKKESSKPSTRKKSKYLSLREKNNVDYITENLSNFGNSSFADPLQKCQSNVSEMNTNDEDPKRTDVPWKLLVSFPKWFTLPSREKLMEMYSKYGALDEEETDVYYNSFAALVAYLRTSDTEKAYLESVKYRPFGAAEVTYHLRCPSGVSRIQESDQKASSENENASPPSDGEATEELENANASQPSDGEATEVEKEATEVGFIVEKLKMMTAMLNACDGRFSVELKSNLECGLKDLLEKVRGV